MQDQELVDLCKAIYRKHREAIDLIVEYGTASKVVDAIEMEILSQVDCEFCNPRGGSVWFLPKPMAEHMPNEELSSWGFLPRPVPVACWARYVTKRQQYIMVLEIGPVADAQKRIRLLHAVQDAGFKFREAGFREEAKFTRILSLKHKPRKDEDGELDLSDEAVRQAIGTLWKRMWKDGGHIVDVLKQFDWS